MSPRSRRRSKRGHSPFSFLLRILRLPFDIIFLTLDYARVLLWSLFQLPRRSHGHDTEFGPCKNAPEHQTEYGSVDRCRMASKYGNIFLFKRLFPSVKRVRDKEGKEFYAWGDLYYAHPVSWPRILALGLVLVLFWGTLSIVALLWVTPRAWDTLAVRVTREPPDRVGTQAIVRDGNAARARELLAAADNAWQAGNVPEALTLYQDAVNADGDNLDARKGVAKAALAADPMRLDVARQALERVLKEEPGNQNALLGMARVRLAYGAPQEAVDHLSNVLAVDPDHDEALRLAAEAQFQAGNLAQAKQAVDRALAQTPESPDLLLLKGRIEEATGNLQAAVEAYEAVPETAGAAPEAAVSAARLKARSGNTDEALKTLEALHSKYPDRQDVILTLTDALRRAGRASRAISMLEQAAAAHPDFVAVRERLVGAYGASGRINDAHRTAEELLAVDPGNAVAHVQLARLFVNLGLPHEAIDHCRKVVAQGTLGHEGRLLLGSALLADSRPAEAAEEFTRLLIAVPDHLQGLLGMARCHMALGQMDKAEDLLLRCADAHPDSAEPWLLLTDLMSRLNKLDQALKYSEQALARDGSEPSAMNNCAALLGFTGGDLDRALDLALAAFEMSPDNPGIADTLGWTYVLRDRPEEGLPYLAYAHRRLPRDPQTAYHYGVALHRSGKSREAVRLLGTALNLSESFPGADDARKRLAEARADVEQGSSKNGSP